jgi:alpha-ketoglutarate-dependent taurine dioxygenase
MTSKRFGTTSLPHDSGLVLEGCEGSAVLELTQDEVIPLFEQHGALLFRGFQCSVDDFVAFTGLFSKDFSAYKGGAFRFRSNMDRETVAGHSTLLTTTGAGQSFPIPLHGELYYFKHHPAMLWFYCSVAPVAQGETTICDGRRLCDGLTAETRAFFRDNAVRYIRNLTAEQWKTAFQTEEIEAVRQLCLENETTLEYHDADGSIKTEFMGCAIRKVDGREVFINNILPVYIAEWVYGKGLNKTTDGSPDSPFPLIVRMADGSCIPRERFRELKKTAESLTACIAWRPNDLLMINNYTHLHGRREADGSQRRIYVRMGEPSWR